MLANPRSRPTPLSDVRTPTSESVGWLLLLFAIEKQRKKVFLNFTLKVREASGRSQFSQTFFSCTFGAKSTKSLRTSFSAGVREPRRCTGRARSGLCATPWRTRRSSPPLFPRQTRVRIRGAAVGGTINPHSRLTRKKRVRAAARPPRGGA